MLPVTQGSRLCDLQAWPPPGAAPCPHSGRMGSHDRAPTPLSEDGPPPPRALAPRLKHNAKSVQTRIYHLRI